MSYCNDLFLCQYGISLNLKKAFSPYDVVNKSDKKFKNKAKFIKHKIAKIERKIKHNLKDHMSYGLTFETNSNGGVVQANVKMFTYPSVTSVEMQICRDCDDDFLKNYKSEEYDKNKVRTCILQNESEGIFSQKEVNIRPGERYRYKLMFPDNSHRYISDVYSYEQKTLQGWPVAYNQTAYENSVLGKRFAEFSEEWNKGLIYGKVNNFKAEDYSNYISSNQLRMIQIHIGTFTKDGTFNSAIKKLDGIKKLGFNAVELLPHGFFYSKNWGYDPSFIFASQYGGTDAFKMFCDYAHKCGINVFVDLVNNHYSMDCPEIMSEAGPYENPDPRMRLKFGPRLNYNDENCEEVREWRINEALYWLRYADGIRFDLTDYTASGGFNTQLNIEIQEHFPGTVTFAESASKEATSPLPADAQIKTLLEETERQKLHHAIIEKAQKDYWGDERQGYTHRWHFDWSHAIENAMLNQNERGIENLKKQVYDAQKHLKIFLSHDEIGKAESDGNSFIVKIILSKLFGFEFCDLSWNSSKEKFISYQKASRSIRELLRRYLTGEEWPNLDHQLMAEKASNGEDIYNKYSKFYGIADYTQGGFSLGELGFGNGISKEFFEELFDSASSLHKAGIAFLFSQPGPKMMFQAFNKPENRFAFFRENSPQFYKEYAEKLNLEKEIDWETESKGHAINSEIIMSQANLDSLNGYYTPQALKLKDGEKSLVVKLNRIVEKNPALSLGEVKDVVGNHKNTISIHTKFNDNEIYSITHFDMLNSYDDYKIYFPKGIWQEILNTDCSEFGGSGNYMNEEIAGDKKASIKLPAASTVIFKKIG